MTIPRPWRGGLCVRHGSAQGPRRSAAQGRVRDLPQLLGEPHPPRSIGTLPVVLAGGIAADKLLNAGKVLDACIWRQVGSGRRLRETMAATRSALPADTPIAACECKVCIGSVDATRHVGQVCRRPICALMWSDGLWWFEICVAGPERSEDRVEDGEERVRRAGVDRKSRQ